MTYHRNYWQSDGFLYIGKFSSAENNERSDLFSKYNFVPQ